MEIPPDYVSFGEVARQQLREQCQYISRYVGGRHGSPGLSQGLRILGSTSDYHSLIIHRDDADEFVRRVMAYRSQVPGAF